MNDIKQLLQLVECLNSASDTPSAPVSPAGEPGLVDMLDEWVIVRTYSAGVWFGRLDKKYKNEVILTQARRMWRWWATESISLSAVAKYGVKHDKSKIVEAVENVWLEAIEIIPCTEAAKIGLQTAPPVKAE